MPGPTPPLVRPLSVPMEQGLSELKAGPSQPRSRSCQGQAKRGMYVSREQRPEGGGGVGGKQKSAFFSLQAQGPQLRPHVGTFILSFLGQGRSLRLPKAPADASWKVPAGGGGHPTAHPPAPSAARCSPSPSGFLSSTAGALSLPSPPASPPGPWCSSRGCISPSSPAGGGELGSWGLAWGSPLAPLHGLL